LIRQGAKLVESAQDVWDELRASGLWGGGLAQPRSPALSAATGVEDVQGSAELANDAVLQALGWEPCGLDQLQARCGWDTAALQAHLLQLELDGQVSRLSGGRFQRLAPHTG
jgi:DNA processing protein